MAQIVALPVTDTLLDFPSEEAPADQARARVTVADRRRPLLVRGAATNSSSAYSREMQPLRPEVTRSEAPERHEASPPDGGYSEFMRILGRGDV